MAKILVMLACLGQGVLLHPTPVHGFDQGNKVSLVTCFKARTGWICFAGGRYV